MSLSTSDAAVREQNAQHRGDRKIGIDLEEYAIPTNRNVVLPSQVPNLADIKLISYDTAKFGSTPERKRLLARWEHEINAGSATGK